MQGLKQARLSAGLTQEQLAKKAGISRVTIAMLETGKRTIAKSSTIIKLADALKVDPLVILCLKRLSTINKFRQKSTSRQIELTAEKVADSNVF